MHVVIIKELQSKGNRILFKFSFSLTYSIIKYVSWGYFIIKRLFGAYLFQGE